MVKIPIHNNDYLTIEDGSVVIRYASGNINKRKWNEYFYCNVCNRYEAASMNGLGANRGCSKCGTTLQTHSYEEVKSRLTPKAVVHKVVVNTPLDSASIFKYVKELEDSITELKSKVSTLEKRDYSVITPIWVLFTWVRLMNARYIKDSKYNNTLLELYEAPKVKHVRY